MSTTASPLHPLVLPLVIVTGLSGAGHSTALGALEDIGFETVDNLPISLIPSLLDYKAARPASQRMPLAIGIDSRTTDIFTETSQALIASFAQQPNTAGTAPPWQTTVLFLTGRPDILQQRFSVTRRRHPLASGGENKATPVTQTIQQERQLLEPIRALATTTIDTSDLSPHQLRQRLQHEFSAATKPTLHINCVSFAYGNGVPADADIVLDVRFLRNPHYEASLQVLTGKDQKVAQYITADPQFSIFQQQLYSLLKTLLTGYAAEGKSYLTIAFGCTGGKHRSVFLTEATNTWIQCQGFTCQVYHRELK